MWGELPIDLQNLILAYKIEFEKAELYNKMVREYVEIWCPDSILFVFYALTLDP